MKILTVVGARPQFIKAAIISQNLNSIDFIQEDILHTGQHYDYGMSQIFFEEMEIPEPTINLKIGSGFHGEITAKMIQGIEQELLARTPDYVLLYGDTNSTLAGALAAAKLSIPIIHIEAGERSYNRSMPEEINRVLTDHISSILFCCSDVGKQRLAKEGISKNVYTVGDIMYDAFRKYTPKASLPVNLKKIDFNFGLATLHRAQNTDDELRLRSIFNALAESNEQIIMPIHPRTLNIIRSKDISTKSNIHLLNPVSYFEMLGLIKKCDYIITDSGGLQKEAYYAEKKCLVVRQETEWTELVDAGMNRIVDTHKDKILNGISWAKTKMVVTNNIYGDGQAGNRIIEHLKNL